MPNIRIIYWNLQDFGNNSRYKDNYVSLCNFIAQVVHNVEADILYIMEFRNTAFTRNLANQLSQALNNLNAPLNNWYFDIIKGALAQTKPDFWGHWGIDGVHRPPYFAFRDTAWHQSANNEGYAVFWNQNLDKFSMESAPPLEHGGVLYANTQSFGVCSAQQPMTVPGGGQFVLPQGTTLPNAILDPANPNNQLVAPIQGQGTAANHILPPGTVIPQGTQIGNGGITITINGNNHIIIPQNYTLVNNSALPLVDEIITPAHVLSLVMKGRIQRIRNGNQQIQNTLINNYNLPPGINNYWNDGYINFPNNIFTFFYNQAQNMFNNNTLATNQGVNEHQSRRAVFCTIKVNIPGGNLQDRLIPINIYHTPPFVADRAMRICSYARALYQAYDFVGNQWIYCVRAIVGGDWNINLPQNILINNPINNLAHQNTYEYYTTYFVQGGAECNNGGGSGVRVNNFPRQIGIPPVNNPNNQSLLKLRQFGWMGNVINTNNTTDYLDSALDNIFYRGFTPAQTPIPAVGEIYNLLQAVLPGGNLNLQVGDFLNNIPLFHQWGAGQNLHDPNIQNPHEFAHYLANQFNQPLLVGQFQSTPERCAAELIKLSVSDHLPVIFEMNL